MPRSEARTAQAAVAATLDHVERRLAPILTAEGLDSLRGFFAPGGPAESFRIHIDSTCVEPFQWRTSWDRVPLSWAGVHDLDRAWWPLKYAAQTFLPHMLDISPFVTSDWQQANASIVVLFVLHMSGSPALTQQRCLLRLRRRSRAWQATAGASHFFVLPNDRGPCCINGVYKDVEFLHHHVIGNGELLPSETPTGRPLQQSPKVGMREPAPPLPCFEAHKDISIPTPNLHWPRVPHAHSPPRVAARRRRSAHVSGRKYLLFHAGLNKFSRCRYHLVRLFSADSSSLVRPALNRTAYAQGMLNARFCPICGGYAPFTPRLVEALSAECVPVFVREYWLPPWADILNYSAFSLSVRLDDLPSLRQIALAADHAALVRAGRRARHAFEFHLDRYTGRDVLPLLLYSMYARLGRSVQVPRSLASAMRPATPTDEPGRNASGGDWRSLVRPLVNSVEIDEHYTTRWAVPDEPPTFQRPVRWMAVEGLIQNYSHNKPSGDAYYRVRDRASATTTRWRCRTAPLDFDARQCTCHRTGT